VVSEAQPRPLVVFSERLGEIGDEERRIEGVGAELRVAPLWDVNQIRANASAATAVMLGAVEPFDAAALESLPALLAVVRRGVGYDNVDIDAATALGIIVAIVPDASVEEVSDHALALLLGAERRITAVDRAVHAGVWQRDPAGIQAARAGARRFRELRLGIVGFGRIGQALARKAAPLYAQILATDPVADLALARDLGVHLVDMDTLVTSADHISLHAPLVPSTRDLVDHAFLERLRPGAVIVNTSRGGLVHQPSMIEAIRSGRLGAAGLDVTVDEPLPTGDPLLQVPDIILTAHSASWSTTARQELSRRSTDAVLAVLAGAPPTVVANPAVLANPRLRLGATGGQR
jgi:D-3-phosphoglycerate dehydrogenase